MSALRILAPLGIAGVLVGAVAVAGATTYCGAESEATPYPISVSGLSATASDGGEVTHASPSRVGVRLVRVEAALARATALVDQGKGRSTGPEMRAALAGIEAAWAAARAALWTTPAPPRGPRVTSFD